MQRLRNLLLLLAVTLTSAAASAQTHNWNQDFSGNWSTALDWTPTGVPNSASDYAALAFDGASPYTVTMNMDVLLDRLDVNANNLTLLIQSQALTLNTLATVDGGTLRLISGSILGGGEVNNTAQITTLGSSTLENLYNRGVLDAMGANAGGTGNLLLTGPAYSEGTINVTSIDAGHAAILRTDPGTTLSNFGTLEFLPGAGGTRSFRGALDNNLFTRIKADTNFQIGPITNTQNTFEIFPNVNASFSTGTDFHMNGGSLQVDGTFTQSNSDFFWTAGSLVNVPPRLINGDLILDVNNADPGTLDILGSSTIAGILRAGQQVDAVGATAGSTGTLTWTGVGDLHNFGSVVLRSEDAGHATRFISVVGARMINHGSWKILPGTGGARYIRGDFLNETAGSMLMQANTIMEVGPTIENQGSWTVDSGTTLSFNSGLNFTQSGGVLQIDGTFLHINGSDDFTGGSVNGLVELVNSTLSFGAGFTSPFTALAQGTTNLTGDIESGQTLWNRGSNAGSTATLILTGPTENRGTLTLDSVDAGHASRAGTIGVALLNSGTLNVDPGAGGTRYLRGDITTTGTLNFNTATILETGTHSNNGNWNLAPGVLVSFNNSVTFNQGAGTLQNDGTFQHINGFDNFTGGTVNGVLELVNSTLSLDPAFTTPFDVLVQGTTSLSGDIESGQTLWARGSNAGSTATLNLTGATENRGTIVADSVDAGHASRVGTTDKALLNSGTLRSDVAAGGARYLRGDLTNTGTIEINANTILEDGPIVNNGTFRVASGAQATFQNGMTYEQNSGLLQVDGSFTHINGTDRFLGGQVIGIPALVNSALILGAGFTAPGELTLQGNSNLTGDIETGQKLLVQGSNQGATGTLTITAPLTNRGEIEVSSVDAGHAANLKAPLGTNLTNEGTIVVTSGAGGSRRLDMELHNAGLVDVQVPTTFGIAGSSHLNSGTFQVTVPLTITGNSFTNEADGRFESNNVVTHTTFPLVNRGTFAPGPGIAVMWPSGNYIQEATGKLEIELGGLIPLTEHDQLSISGTAAVDGIVELKAANGFQPKFGDQFVILAATSITGTFSGVTYDGNLPMGYGFELVDTGTQIIAQVAQTINSIGPGKVALNLGDPVPGLAGQNNTFQVSGATGSGQVVIVFGLATGSTATGTCAGVFFDIDAAQQVGVGFASYNGSALISAMVPAGASGLTAYFQALDLNRCELSARNSFLFP
jgi:fibronectin-binding autotransporter adhesin